MGHLAQAFLVAVIVAGCASSSGESRTGTVAGTCGLHCKGSVACTNGALGYVGSTEDACVFQGLDGSVASLDCDGKVHLSYADGTSEDGTWSGSGVKVSLVVGDEETTCDIDTQGKLQTTCNECFLNQCKTEIAACVEPCPQLIQCVGACTDDECEQGCKDEQPEWVDEMDAIASCQADKCSEECKSVE